MNVLLISPGFPSEMPLFTEALAKVGAGVIGLGDQPIEALPDVARRALSHYLRATSMWDEQKTVREVLDLAKRIRIDRVECLWEPGMILAARIREALGVPGLSVDQTIAFRDKEVMKQRLDAAGIRTPHHHRASSANAVREAAERVGYPLIVKPIAGAGSADTYRIADRTELEGVIPMLRHVPEVSVEEFIEAEEFTFDTICHGGRIGYFNICWYRPRPLVARSHEWISPQTIALRDPHVDRLAPGRRMGARVLEVLGFRDGFTHMEWYLKDNGEAVFGEIGARPPGARTVELMNYACDIDTFTGWAEAIVHGRFSQRVDRKYNCASIFKRAHGQGWIRRIEGVDHFLGRYGRHVMVMDLLPVGAHRRDWKAVLISDGMIIVRHPDLAKLVEIADSAGADITLYAGS
ncbi:MAG: ATP-grasp domain-containing protein [Phycisphaeraceae bacterium]|nr:ATP-grasp domain-containing protein [Phycisphaeraceae bacterium]